MSKKEILKKRIFEYLYTSIPKSFFQKTMQGGTYIKNIDREDRVNYITCIGTYEKDSYRGNISKSHTLRVIHSMVDDENVNVHTMYAKRPVGSSYSFWINPKLMNEMCEGATEFLLSQNKRYPTFEKTEHGWKLIRHEDIIMMKHKLKEYLKETYPYKPEYYNN